MDEGVVIRAEGLRKYFPAGASGLWGRRKAFLRAVDGVSFHVREGETLGLVGESGCGKSTVGMLLLGLHRPDAGRVLYRGEDILALEGEAKRRMRRNIQVVFQDPQSSLDPRMLVKKAVGFPLEVNGLARGAEVTRRVEAMLAEVGLRPEHMYRYPHEFSGGQRQRINIARALITGPRFVVFDEPTSALDVSVQAQILNLVKDLQKRRGYSYLFISHDLSVIRHVSHRVAVMYLGRIVETAPRGDLFQTPRHPYTRALMAAVPKPDPARRQPLALLPGDVPSPVHIPPGCRFHPRCPEVMDVCRETEPAPVEVGPDHVVACHLWHGTGFDARRRSA
ncbi:peptide/nickel transport system ATP-binding protein [Desulfacinum infernum DSM 9756]|uniref:Peptide/nickel transport system ATP-binding protein n=1 Tax=Desulfacinum infernum DSM 9756 TaxID=1121391 RepID=A0A1M4VME1_9BACT|nr:ABC transporter ATP-binding protein [Desulfacinum infernum]SHE70022.1 peptide/nickel transport system ATP-binding protein [Desulfacinum infernum DSM 9756]